MGEEIQSEKIFKTIDCKFHDVIAGGSLDSKMKYQIPLGRRKVKNIVDYECQISTQDSGLRERKELMALAVKDLH